MRRDTLLQRSSRSALHRCPSSIKPIVSLVPPSQSLKHLEPTSQKHPKKQTSYSPPPWPPTLSSPTQPILKTPRANIPGASKQTNKLLSTTMATNFLLVFLLPFLFLTRPTSSSSEQDLLLSFKSSIQDPSSSLSNWSPNSTNPCKWTGITCFNSTVTSLDLQSLNLSGEISTSICQLKQLSQLNLANNLFNQPIPLHLSQCTSLLTLNLSNNFLWGTLPHQFYQLSSLRALDLSKNHIEGQIPVGLGSLQGLQVLNLGSNLFSGTLHPAIFSNLSELVILDLSQNPTLASELPQVIGKMSKLKAVFMQRSGLYGGIPDSLLDLNELEILDLSKNNLTGKIPLGFGLGLKLVSVDLSQNLLSGSFPSDVCYGKALVELSLHSNSFTGVVSNTIERCQSLERFQVNDNGFSGGFPSGLWSLPKIMIIRAENNQFSGNIPDSIGVSSQLEQVQIDNNSFTGRIPQSLGLIKTMYRLSASLNGFYGNLPENFCDSPVMSIINLSHNSLSGSIPELKNCSKLVSLSLADNSFTGGIPASLAQLPVLTYIDLSNNNLSGGIPEELQNLKLALFNVSYNQLSGSVPFSLISGLPASFLEGNPGLCGPGLPNPCNGPSKKNGYWTNGLVLALTAIAFSIGVLFLGGGFFAMYRLSRRTTRPSSWKSVFFYPLKITEEDLLMALDKKNIVGGGPFGNVHVIRLTNGEFIAIKKILNSGNLSFRTVKAEIKILAKARHKNLAKVLGFCYSDSEILLIHECLQKGSLGDILLRSDLSFEWRVRLQVALGAAQGLAYLHKDYIPYLLHRNIKSNNILLDDGFEAKITGFGLDRAIGEASYQSSIVSESGSHCYLAPEHGCNKKATEQMDVYSFGVVLLELITGRQAEQPESRESLDVVKWVRRKINMTNGMLQILDARISGSSQPEMMGALELALRCTSVMPEKRPAMDEVVRSLQSLSSIIHPPRVFSGESSSLSSKQ